MILILSPIMTSIMKTPCRLLSLAPSSAITTTASKYTKTLPSPSSPTTTIQMTSNMVLSSKDIPMARQNPKVFDTLPVDVLEYATNEYKGSSIYNNNVVLSNQSFATSQDSMSTSGSSRRLSTHSTPRKGISLGELIKQNQQRSVDSGNYVTQGVTLGDTGEGINQLDFSSDSDENVPKINIPPASPFLSTMITNDGENNMVVNDRRSPPMESLDATHPPNSVDNSIHLVLCSLFRCKQDSRESCSAVL